MNRAHTTRTTSDQVLHVSGGHIAALRSETRPCYVHSEPRNRDSEHLTSPFNLRHAFPNRRLSPRWKCMVLGPAALMHPDPDELQRCNIHDASLLSRCSPVKSAQAIKAIPPQRVQQESGLWKMKHSFIVPVICLTRLPNTVFGIIFTCLDRPGQSSAPTLDLAVQDPGSSLRVQS